MRGVCEGGGESQNTEISKKSIFRRLYSQISISHPHGKNKRPKISSGDGLGAELKCFLCTWQ